MNDDAIFRSRSAASSPVSGVQSRRESVPLQSGFLNQQSFPGTLAITESHSDNPPATMSGSS